MVPALKRVCDGLAKLDRKPPEALRTQSFVPAARCRRSGNSETLAARNPRVLDTARSLRRCHKSSPVAMVRANQAERIMSDKATTQRRRLGKNGLEVLPIGLGCMSLSGTYGPTDDKAAEALLQRAVELGIDHFDSSDMYGWGHNEELLGRALKGLHNNIVIATKFGQTRQPGGANGVNGRPEYVQQACEASLKRLGIDTIDLYYQHRVDPGVPVEDIAADKRCTVAQLCLAWLLAQGPDVIPIPGTKRIERLQENLGALQVRLTPEEAKTVSEVIPVGAAAGTRYPEGGMKGVYI